MPDLLNKFSVLQVLSAFDNQPVMLEERSVKNLYGHLSGMIDYVTGLPSELTGDLSAGMSNDQFWDFDEDDYIARFRPYTVVDGVLQIPVKGVLLHDFPWQLGGWATGYDYIWQAFKRGIEDANVRGIALVTNSPGGTVAGNFDLVDKMYALKGEKPIWAFAHESAYSAAYSIVSVADKICVSQTGGVGSIGVIVSHASYEKLYENIGIDITHIFKGKHKADGNTTERLPDDVKDKIEDDIGIMYDVFVSTVARNRPSLSEDVIRETNALTFIAHNGVEAGLADEVGSLGNQVSAFADFISSTDEDFIMTKKNSAESTTVDTSSVGDDSKKMYDQGYNAGLADGSKAERDRIATIMNCDAAKDRPKAANQVAMTTNMSAEDAETFLEGLELEAKAEVVTEEPKADTGAAFKAAMSESNPEVGADDTTEDEPDPVASSTELAKKFGLDGWS